MPGSTDQASRVVLTLGHSAHRLEAFVGLAKAAGGDVVVDVRSVPFSRWRPHFNRDALARDLPRHGLDYLMLGDVLGGRPPDGTMRCSGGVADYEAMAGTDDFEEGMARVLSLASERRPVLVCSEGDPATCHRCLLVGRRLLRVGAAVVHVLPDGTTRTQRDVEVEILRETGHDLFSDEADVLARGYRERAERYAHRDPATSGPGAAKAPRVRK